MSKNQQKIKVSLLGGLNEIGKNITVIEYCNQILLIDCGQSFPEDEMLGVDSVIPDFTYLERNQKKILGLLVTHGHEDHIGAIPYLLKKVNVPIYTLPMTMGLIEKKLKEHNLNPISKNIVKPKEVIKLGSMSFEFIRVNHSIPDSCAIAIYTPSGTIFHTGDFKIDFTPIDNKKADLSRIAEIGNKGVTMMLSESTNVERPGYTVTEKAVGGTFEHIFSEVKDSRILVATFASNVHRLQQIFDAAYKSNKKVAVTGRSMTNIIEVASSLGYLKIPKKTFIDLKDVNRYKNHELVIITTGSQGEPLSALTRISKSEHRQIQITPGDVVVFSAHPIPGNEITVSRVINNLYARGAKVIHDTVSDIHVSGHACQEELKLMLSLVKPKFFIPFHGEKRHIMLHADLANDIGVKKENIFILENGDVVEFDKRHAKLSGKIQSGDILVDGLGIGDVGNIVLRDRKHLSEDGILIVIVNVSKEDRAIINSPEIVTRGFVYVKESSELIEDSKKTLDKVITDYNSNRNKDWNTLKNSIRDELRKFLFSKTNRNPMILPIIIEV